LKRGVGFNQLNIKQLVPRARTEDEMSEEAVVVSYPKCGFEAELKSTCPYAEGIFLPHDQ